MKATVLYRKMVPFLLLMLILPAATVAQTPLAKCDSTWVEYDALDQTSSDTTGMLFHFRLTISNYEGQEVKAVLFLRAQKANAWMTSSMDGYRSASGFACSVKTLPIKGGRDKANFFKDVALFVPYDALALATPGEEYYYHLFLRTSDGKELLKGSIVRRSFDWASHSTRGKIKSIKLSHNETENGEVGLKVVSNFEIANCMDHKIAVDCFVYDKDGKNVATTNKDYSTTDNQLYSSRMVQPPFDPDNGHLGTWQDFELFFPYSVFPQLPGEHAYTLKVKLRDPAREYAVLSTSEPEVIYLTTNEPVEEENCDKPTIEWLSTYETSSPTFTAKLVVRSKTAISATDIALNGGQTRGMKTVRNDNKDKTLSETLSLQEGLNEIVVSATNACGTTVNTFRVNYRKVSLASIGDQRVALVVGNSNYKSQRLANPANDARDVSKSLRQLGFDVITLIDASQQKLEQAVKEFSRKANAQSVALFYYAGHGIQKDGCNYLVPIDANVTEESEIKYKCTDVNYVLECLEQSGCLMNIVMLDACRDNPFAKSWSRGAGQRGLANINAPKGTFIGYATAANDVAQDGKGRNSPFTAAFLETLQEPGLELDSFFKEVRMKVYNATEGNQTPWGQSGFLGNFYFNTGE